MNETLRGWMLWMPWLLAPLAWATHETLSYILVWWVCDTGGYWALHLTSLIAFAVAAAAGGLAWRNLNRAGGPRRDAEAARSRFVSIGGATIAAISLLGILAEAIPNWVLDACFGIT